MRNKEKSLAGFLPDFFYTVYFENFIPDASLLEDDLSSGIKSIQMKTKSVS